MRDGLQIEKPIPLSAKLELLAAVAATGVREVEATAFVSPSKVPSMADAAELAAELHQYPDIDFSALVASPGGAKRAVAAGLRSIEYVVAASDPFSQANVGRSSAEATEQISEIVAIAHDSDVSVEVIVAVAWDCPFDGPTPPQRVLDIAAAARDHGADRFCIADTIGTTTPGRVRSLIAQLRPVIGELPLGGHFHNTRGAGLASAYAAVRRASPGWTPRSADSADAHSHRAPPATSPPRTWCTCCATATSTSTSTCRPRSPQPASRNRLSAMTCRVPCCVPVTG